MPGLAVERYAPSPGVDRGAEARNLPVGGRRHLHLFDVVAALGGDQVVLAAGLRPFNGHAQLHGAEGRYRLVGVVRNLAPKSAADLRRDDAYLVLRHTRDDRGEEPRDVRVLRGVPQRQLTGWAYPLRYR